MKKFSGVATITATLAATLWSPPLPASAEAIRAGTLQPYACANSTSDILDENDSSFAISDTGKSIRCVNNNGNAGYIINNLPTPCILSDSQFVASRNRRPNSLSIQVRGIDPDDFDKVTVRLCFKPQLGTPDLITVDKSLKDFAVDRNLRFNTAYATRNDLFGDRPGVPDLRKLVIFVNKKGVAVAFGSTVCGNGNTQSVEPFTINLAKASCANEACGTSSTDSSSSNSSKLKQKFQGLKNRKRQ